MRQKMIAGLLAVFLIAGMTGTAFAASDSDTALDPDTAPEHGTELPAYTVIPAPATSKESSKSIRISWSSTEDDCVATYYVMRRKTQNNEGQGTWKTIAEVSSDGIKDGPENVYTDRLSSAKIQQYEYKICTLSPDGTIDTRDAAYAEETDRYTALGTNIKICIDPGHYGELNNNYGYTGENGKHRYSEAKFTLKIGKSLQEELKASYGIDSYMTRTSNKISLTYKGKKYTNETLDKGNIAVRGYMAKVNDCDLFISLHTNSTSRATDPWNQPKSVNKVYVFVNNTAHTSTRGMQIANAVGTSLTEYNQGAGIQKNGFITRTVGHAAPFTDQKNDAPKEEGTVLYRKGSSGSDYYGVLRGCSVDGIPGILVEHAFHATKVMRKQAKASAELYENWAACDAYGIACGFGFEP